MRKSYLAYFLRRVRAKGPFYLLTGGLQYALVYLGYRTRRSLAGPLNGALSLTYSCNLKCTMCDLPDRAKVYEKDPERRSLSFDDYVALIGDFAAIGTPSISFTGGEPLLHSSFFSLVKEVRKQGMISHVTTNGWLVERDIEKIFESGLDSISVSLDGCRAETHDAIRQVPRSFEKATHALELLVAERKRRGSKLMIGISATFSEKNFTEAQGLVSLAERIGTNVIGFMPVNYIAPSLRDKRPVIESPVLAQIEDTVAELIRMKAAHPIIETTADYFRMFGLCLTGGKLPVPCLASYTTFVVDTYGDYFPCYSFYQMERPWGNFFESGLADYWKGAEIANERRGISACRECFWNCQVETNLLFSRYAGHQQ